MPMLTEAAMTLELNPPGGESEYLRGLNECFEGWGDWKTFEWAFRRTVAPEPAADLMVLRDGSELLAGSAVTYRRLELANGERIRIGIMTGSWTLPAARGRGCFSRLIEASLMVTSERGGALLLAFVTADNPSCRQLRRSGAAFVPTSYLFSEGGPQAEDVPRWTAVDADERHAAAIAHSSKGQCHFIYERFEDWRCQFLERPYPTGLLSAGDGAFAVLERKGGTDRLQALWTSPGSLDFRLAELRAQTAAQGNRLFAFSSEAAFGKTARAMGFVERPGYVTTMVTDDARLRAAMKLSEAIEAPSHAMLTDATSPWFLGAWSLQSGDRM